MDDTPMNSNRPVIAACPATKKKAPRKPWSELTPAELAKLDADSTKRRNQRTKDKENKATTDIATEAAALRVVHH
ncbi:hypothetical protein D1007_43151 [Hordeum vulgare]|nr:hypothetical protein D1007_43151 [Hordeum vulgare]